MYAPAHWLARCECTCAYTHRVHACRHRVRRVEERQVAVEQSGRRRDAEGIDAAARQRGEPSVVARQCGAAAASAASADVVAAAGGGHAAEPLPEGGRVGAVVGRVEQQQEQPRGGGRADRVRAAEGGEARAEAVGRWRRLQPAVVRERLGRRRGACVAADRESGAQLDRVIDTARGVEVGRAYTCMWVGTPMSR